MFLDERLLIVGGGIGGLATALAVARHGIPTTVAEQAAEFREIGAGLQLAPNASWALNRLGVLPQVHETAVFPARMVWMDAVSGEPLTSLDLGAPFRERYGFPYLVMHRSDLLDALVRACAASPLIALTTGKTFDALVDHGDVVEARFRDGTTIRARGLIGADGLHSRVRQCVLADGEPICSGYVAYRGAIPIADMSVHAGLDNVVLWTGPDMHFVQYPLRRGELYNQVAVFKSDRYASGAAEWGTEDELEQRFSAGAPLVRAALTRIKRDRRWPMYDRLPVQLDPQPRDAHRRCRAPDASVPRARRVPSARGRRGPRRQRRVRRRRERRRGLSSLRSRAAGAHGSRPNRRTRMG